MPCRDYYSGDEYNAQQTRRYEEQRDKLARIACRAMTLLEEKGITLHSKEAQQWFAQHKKDDAAAAARKAEEERREAEKARLKKAALSKLSEAEKKVLGVK